MLLSESELGRVESEMQDLETARKRLNEKGLTLSIVKEGEIVFETGSRGMSGLLGAIERYEDELRGASVADKVVGKAVALLCVYAEVKAVYAATLSRKAKALLEENSIGVEWDTLVPNVLDADKVAACPFEELAAEIADPKEVYRKLKALQNFLGGCRSNRMNGEHERFISEEEELERIRAKKLSELREKKQEMTDEPVHVTDSSFNDVVKKHSLALIDFWAPWCGPCRALAPTIEELNKEYAGRVFVGKLNVDENPKTAECFDVSSIPTMLIMKNGEEVDRIVGCVQKKYIEAALRKHLE
jgi:thioredoxin 1